MTLIATFAFAVGILGLFWLNRNPAAQTSGAVWLPVLWLLISGSRPVSFWFDPGALSSADQVLMEGSPLDRNIFIVLLAGGIIVLLQRQTSVSKLVRRNPALFAFVAFCALSILWSDYPDVAFKRWIKSLGDFVMIVLTDRDRSNAIKQLLATLGFILLPLSVLFIKYYPDIGRSYAAHWDSTVYYVGVAEDKNMLGLTCLVFGLGAAWRFLQELGGNRSMRIVLAHGAMFAMALWLLRTCDSMTSFSCLVLSSGLIAALTFLKMGKRRGMVHLMVASILLVCFSPLFLGLGGGLLSSLGRNSTLTGRTDLWADLLKIDLNPLIGAGFESFWLGDRLKQLWKNYWWHPTEAHNGYLEIYLNLGWLGVAFLLGIIITGYRNIMRLLSQDAEAGRLRLAYFVVGVAYNFTEAATRTLNLVWVFFLLAVFALPNAPAAKAPVVPSPFAGELLEAHFMKEVF